MLGRVGGGDDLADLAAGGRVLDRGDEELACNEQQGIGAGEEEGDGLWSAVRGSRGEEGGSDRRRGGAVEEVGDGVFSALAGGNK